MKNSHVFQHTNARSSILATLFIISGFALRAQTIGGSVYDACTGEAIGGSTIHISVNIPGSPLGSWSLPTDPDGSWDFSFFENDPKGPYLITVEGGASSPGSYIYNRNQGNNLGLNFDLLPKNWDIKINGDEVPPQNNPQSPYILCSNQDNCLQLTGTDNNELETNPFYCYQVRLYATDASGQAGDLLATSLCHNFSRPTLAEPCGDQAFDLNSLLPTPHPELIRLEVWHFCCNRECQPTEGELVNKEVVFVEVLDEVQLGFQFLAGDYVDELNGPPTDDGLIPPSEQLPGPFVGAGTVGLNIGAFSDDGNVLSWQYSIEEVDCTTGNTIATLFVSPVDDDGGPLPENETFIDKLIGLPGQETQAYFPYGTGLLGGTYTSGACYKVTLGANTVCGGAEVFSYFQIQQTDANNNPCTFCLIAPPSNGWPTSVGAESSFSVSPNPAAEKATLTVTSVEEAYSEFAVYDLKGREVLTAFKGNLEKGKKDIVLDLSSFSHGLYFLKGQIGNNLMVKKIIVQ